MRQVSVHDSDLGGIRVFGFGEMIVVAFISATWLAAWRAKRGKLDPDVILDMAFWIVFSGMVGARLTYCYEYWGQDIKSFWDILQYWKGGIVFYGGIIGGFAGVLRLSLVPGLSRSALTWTSSRRHWLSGTLFGRIGCFLNGCCYGNACQVTLGGLVPDVPRLRGCTRSPVARDSTHAAALGFSASSHPDLCIARWTRAACRCYRPFILYAGVTGKL